MNEFLATMKRAEEGNHRLLSLSEAIHGKEVALPLSNRAATATQPSPRINHTAITNKVCEAHIHSGPSNQLENTLSACQSVRLSKRQQLTYETRPELVKGRSTTRTASVLQSTAQSGDYSELVAP